MTARSKAILQMLICATLWSIAGIFIKLLDWNPFVIAGWRSLIAALCVLVFVKLYKLPLKFTKRSALNGLFMMLTFFAFVAANKLTTAANAIVLQFTTPIFLMIYSSVLFHRSLRRADVLAGVFTLAGIALFFFDRLETGYLIGNCVAIGAGAFMAGMYLCLGSGEESDRISGMLTGHLFTALVGIPFSFFTVNTVNGTAIVSILALGIFQLGIAYILFVLSTRACPPLACSLLGAVEPLLNPVWVALFDGEMPGLFALFGGVIVIATVTVWCIWDGRHPQEQPTEPA